MACTFCATGKAGFARQLSAHEILDQVMVVAERLQRRVSHVGGSELDADFACAALFGGGFFFGS